jgi:hypothetical protein
MDETCPICGDKLVWPIGPENADIYIVGSSAQKSDYVDGLPFSGDYGSILRKELFRLNVFKLEGCRRGYLWLHPKTKTCDINYHRARFQQEVSNHRYVFLMGAEFGNGLLYAGSVTDKSGLRHDIMHIKGIVSVSPMSAQSEGVGELREALTNFAKLILEGADVPDDVE